MRRWGITAPKKKMKKFWIIIPLMGILFAACQNTDPEPPTTKITRTVKPTVSFSMEITGINPAGYGQYDGAKQICNAVNATCCKVRVGGHTSTEVMLLAPLSATLEGNYDNLSMSEYVRDNSYVGARIICVDADSYDNKLNEDLTTEEKAALIPYIDLYLKGSPNGPFKL